MNLLIAIFISILIIVGIIILGMQIPKWAEEEAKTTAQKIIDFRSDDISCNKLKTLYLEYYYKKYTSHANLQWFWEVNDKLIEKECVDKATLDNLEFIEICSDGQTVGCQISKLKYPEVYENFNFRESVMALNTTHLNQYEVVTHE